MFDFIEDLHLSTSLRKGLKRLEPMFEDKNGPSDIRHICPKTGEVLKEEKFLRKDMNFYNPWYRTIKG